MAIRKSSIELGRLNENKTQEERLKNIQDSMGYKPTDDELNKMDLARNINDTDKLPPTYTYVPKLVCVFSNGEYLDLVEFINIIQFDIDFTTHIFPLISLILYIPKIYIPRIQSDDNIRFRLDLLTKSVRTDNPYLHDTLFTLFLSKVKQVSSPVNIETEIYNENNFAYQKDFLELKLVPTECLDANKFLFSGNYLNTTVLNVMTYMTRDIPNKVYIQQPDNIKVYDQLIFPANNVFYSLQFLDNYYGIYDRGIKLFYGFDQFRIQSENHYDQNGTNKVKIAFSTESDVPDAYSYLENGLTKNGNDNIIFTVPHNVKIYDRHLYNREILGTEVSFFGRTQDVYFEQQREYTIDRGLSKVKSYLNDLNNKQKEQELLSKALYAQTIEIKLNNIILDVDSWFKGFELEFDSNYYENLSGIFNMNRYTFRLSMVNSNIGQSFNVASVITLGQT